MCQKKYFLFEVLFYQFCLLVIQEIGRGGVEVSTILSIPYFYFLNIFCWINASSKKPIQIRVRISRQYYLLVARDD